jgi:hypothetical protein
MADRLGGGGDIIVNAFACVLSCGAVTCLKMESLKALCYRNVTPRFIFLLI